jgi:mitogen-activated protein kinase 1/3
VETDEQVAVKKVAIQTEISEARRVFREIKILQRLHHPNCLSLIDISAATSFENFKSVYVVTEYFPADLAEIIKSPQPLTDVHVQTFMYQLLRGLKYLHSCNVLHRDLKPNNILVNRECDLSICDFGLARVSYELEDKDMTQYVVTRWYRAPELIMLSKDYSYQVACCMHRQGT